MGLTLRRICDMGRRMRVLASGATELWAADVRRGHRLDALGEAALEVERPFHVALDAAELTLCGDSTRELREYSVDFQALEPHIRCPLCAKTFADLAAGSG
jgi:hypothetical protein